MISIVTIAAVAYGVSKRFGTIHEPVQEESAMRIFRPFNVMALESESRRSAK